jgi:hypothetical protein
MAQATADNPRAKARVPLSGVRRAVSIARIDKAADITDGQIRLCSLSSSLSIFTSPYGFYP